MAGLSLGLGLGLGSAGSVAAVQLSASTVTEGASPNTVIGALSVANHPSGGSGWTFTETTDTDGKFNISSANLRTSGTWAYTPSTTSYSVTITASKSGQDDIVQTFSVSVLAVLGNLALDSYTWTPGVPASGSITGAHDANEVITLGSGWPSGLTINSAARTWAYDGTGTDGTGTGSLIGTHPQATNSPHTTSGLAWTLSTTTAATFWTPANATAGTIKLWYDPSDPANVTQSSNVVSQLNDGSGNATTLFASGTAKPAWQHDWFPQNALAFDGSNDDLRSSATVVQSQPCVLYQSLMIAADTSFRQAFDGSGSVLWRPSQSGAQFIYAGSAILPGAPTILKTMQVMCRYNGASSAFSINGGTETTGDTGSGTINGNVAIGNSATNDAPFGGHIATTILTNGNVTTGSTLDDYIKGYIAWHDGTWESLPSGHTYRYKAPKAGVTPATPTIPWQSSAYISHGADGTWNATNIFDPCIVDHPSDPTKLFLYCSGQTNPVATGVASIGLYVIDKAMFPASAPTFVQVVLTKGTGAEWDNAALGVRLGSVIKVGSTYYMYYCTQKSTPTNSIGVATSTDGINWTKQGTALFDPTGDETCTGEPAIWWEGGVATIIYDYHAGTNPEDILQGYRAATSSSLTGPFTKQAGDILRRPRRTPKVLQTEAHQIVKRNGRYYLLSEVGDDPTGSTPYRIYLASCATVNGRYQWEKLVLAENPSATGSTGSSPDGSTNPTGGGEKYHVATPGLFTINGTDYLFRTSAPDFASPYGFNHWNMYVGTATGIFDTV